MTIRSTARSPQWAYQRKPVYCFAGDRTTGRGNGKVVNGVWRALK